MGLLEKIFGPQIAAAIKDGSAVSETKPRNQSGLPAELGKVTKKILHIPQAGGTYGTTEEGFPVFKPDGSKEWERVKK